MKTIAMFFTLVLVSLLTIRSGNRCDSSQPDAGGDVLTNLETEAIQAIHPGYSSMKKIFL